MSKCPKCGGARIIGPKYENDIHPFAAKGPNERLRYTCFECGYSETSPTLDSKKRAGAK